MGIPESVPNAIFTPASESVFRFFLAISSPALYLAISGSLRAFSTFSGLRAIAMAAGSNPALKNGSSSHFKLSA